MKIDQKIQEFKGEVKVWAKKLQVFPYEVRLKTMRNWGACSADGILYFNNALLFRRKELQTYVIVHELLHLKIRNHGKLFQALMSLHLKNWKELDKELNAYSQEQAEAFHENRI